MSLNARVKVAKNRFSGRKKAVKGSEKTGFWVEKKTVLSSQKVGFGVRKNHVWGRRKPLLGSEKNGFEFVGFGVGKTGFEFAKNRFGVQKNKFASSWDSVCPGVKTCSKDGDDDDEHSTLNIPFTVSLKRQL